jgi:hypothetical protein
MITVKITEDSTGHHWARVVQQDPITAADQRLLQQRFKTRAEAMAWAQKITRQWKEETHE